MALKVPKMDSTPDLSLMYNVSACFQHFTKHLGRFGLDFVQIVSSHIVTSAVLPDQKYVKLRVIECSSRPKSARNALNGRFNPYVGGFSRC